MAEPSNEHFGEIRGELSELQDVLKAIRAKQTPPGISTMMIAIDGPGGAGKTSLAERPSKELGGAPILHTDDFASWEEPINWWPRLLKEALEPALSRPGRPLPAHRLGEERSRTLERSGAGRVCDS